MIEHAFTLRTALFEATTPGPTFLNPHCFGEDFAAWLAERLAAAGLTPSKPIAEDWGWALIVPHGSRRYTVSIAIIEDTIGRVPAQWRVGIAFERPMNPIWLWFASAPTQELRTLASTLEGFLRADARFAHIEPW